MQSSEFSPDLTNPPVGPWQERFTEFLLKGIAAYLILSILTLPFAGSVWSGEIPVLALIQLPKITFAHWLRTDIVMPLIRMLGLSAGSFSPDFRTARPYGLFLSYLIPSLCLLGYLTSAGRFHAIHRRWALIVMGSIAVDFMVMMYFGTNPWNRFSMY